MHDWKPTHRKVPKAVLKALEHSTNCTREYNEHLNEELNKGEQGGDVDWTEVTRLANIANAAEAALDAAREFALNGCQHKNVSYQGSMHFSAGEVDDDIVEVCEDCGYLFSGTEEGGE